MVDSSGRLEPWEVGLAILGGICLILLAVASIFGTACTETLAQIQDGAATIVDLVIVLGGLLTLATIVWYLAMRRIAARPRTISYQWMYGGFGILLVLLALAIRPEMMSQTAPTCVDGLGLF